MELVHCHVSHVSFLGCTGRWAFPALFSNSTTYRTGAKKVPTTTWQPCSQQYTAWLTKTMSHLFYSTSCEPLLINWVQLGHYFQEVIIRRSHGPPNWTFDGNKANMGLQRSVEKHGTQKKKHKITFAILCNYQLSYDDGHKMRDRGTVSPIFETQLSYQFGELYIYIPLI